MTKKKSPKDELKSEHFNVRCTPEQKIIIENGAKLEGIGASTWLLQLGLRAVHERQLREGPNGVK